MKCYWLIFETHVLFLLIFFFFQRVFFTYIYFSTCIDIEWFHFGEIMVRRFYAHSVKHQNSSMNSISILSSSLSSNSCIKLPQNGQKLNPTQKWKKEFSAFISFQFLELLETTQIAWCWDYGTFHRKKSHTHIHTHRKTWNRLRHPLPSNLRQDTKYKYEYKCMRRSHFRMIIVPIHNLFGLSVRTSHGAFWMKMTTIELTRRMSTEKLEIKKKREMWMSESVIIYFVIRVVFAFAAPPILFILPRSPSSRFFPFATFFIHSTSFD